jgi:hypothetical protein
MTHNHALRLVPITNQAEALALHTTRLTSEQLESLRRCANGISLRFEKLETVNALLIGGYAEQGVAGVVTVTVNGQQYLRTHLNQRRKNDRPDKAHGWRYAPLSPRGVFDKFWMDPTSMQLPAHVPPEVRRWMRLCSLRTIGARFTRLGFVPVQVLKLRSDQTDSVSVDLHQQRLNGDGRLLSFGHTCGRLRKAKN